MSTCLWSDVVRGKPVTRCHFFGDELVHTLGFLHLVDVARCAAVCRQWQAAVRKEPNRKIARRTQPLDAVSHMSASAHHLHSVLLKKYDFYNHNRTTSYRQLADLSMFSHLSVLACSIDVMSSMNHCQEVFFPRSLISLNLFIWTDKSSTYGIPSAVDPPLDLVQRVVDAVCGKQLPLLQRLKLQAPSTPGKDLSLAAIGTLPSLVYLSIWWSDYSERVCCAREAEPVTIEQLSELSDISLQLQTLKLDDGHYCVSTWDHINRLQLFPALTSLSISQHLMPLKGWQDLHSRWACNPLITHLRLNFESLAQMSSQDEWLYIESMELSHSFYEDIEVDEVDALNNIGANFPSLTKIRVHSVWKRCGDSNVERLPQLFPRYTFEI